MLYHIRFFKVPLVVKSSVHAVFTVTNDLGDLFFYGDATFSVYLNGRFKTNCSWKPGMNSCAVQLQLHSTELERFNGPGKVVLTIKVNSDVKAKDHLYADSEPVILSVQSLPISDSTDRYSIRDVYGVKVVEETGHNFARKLWDAGIALSQYLKENRSVMFPSSQKLEILELGTGCGIVSMTVAQIADPAYMIVATDLPDASDVMEKTLALNRVYNNVSFRVFDWSDENTDLKLTEWDWILISDCTYNPDNYEALIKALRLLASLKTRILLAHKYRHDNEEHFFEMIREFFVTKHDEHGEINGQTIRFVTYVVPLTKSK